MRETVKANSDFYFLFMKKTGKKAKRFMNAHLERALVESLEGCG